MATPEMVPMPQNMPPQMPTGGEKRERKPMYKIPLADGTVLVAYDPTDLIRKMEEYRANAN
jgi:hypothetical protein